MFGFFLNNSSVINLLNSKKLVLLYFIIISNDIYFAGKARARAYSSGAPYMESFRIHGPGFAISTTKRKL